MKEKKVELIELFYDLLYVYAISNMTGLLEAGSGNLLQDAGRYLIICFVILQGWLYLTNYVNRYGEWKWFEYALTAVNMTATVYMANTISNDWQIVSRSFNLAMLVMLVSVLAMYLIRIRLKDKDIRAARNSVKILCIVCVLYFAAFLASVLHYHPVVIWIDVMAVLAGAFLPFVIRGNFDGSVIHFPHLMERFELITIISFGESVVGITDYFDVNFVSLQAILVFLTVLVLFGCYVIQIHELCDHQQEARALRLMFSHYFIVLSVNLITVTFSFLNSADTDRTFAAVMMILALAMFFCAMYTDSVYYFPEISFGKKHWLSVLVFMVIGGGIMCLPFGSGMVLYGAAVIALGNFGMLMGLRRQLTALRA